MRFMIFFAESSLHEFEKFILIDSTFVLIFKALIMVIIIIRINLL